MAAFAKASLPTRSRRALRVIDPVRAKGFSQGLKPHYSALLMLELKSSDPLKSIYETDSSGSLIHPLARGFG